MPLPEWSTAAIRAGFSRLPGSYKTRRWARRLVIALIGFGILVFFGGPPLLRHLAEHQLSQRIMRPVSLGRITLNPYTLRLEVDQLQIGEPGSAGTPPQPAAPPFVSIAKLVVRPSWSSLFRLKPVIDELDLEAPTIHLVRSGAQRFNFSDLLDTFGQPATPGSRPALFSIANIHLENGRIDFDDQVLGTHHRIDQWQVGIPFIANLPAQLDIFVQPLLQARIDGSLLRVTGQTKPFSSTLESTLALQLDQFDLTRLLPYLPYLAPRGLPVKLQQGWLSTQLQLSFARQGGQPQVKLSGTLDLRDLSLADAAAAPLLKVKQIHLDAADIEPLRNLVKLADLRIDAPQLSVTRDAQGRLNLFQLAGNAPPSQEVSNTASGTAPPFNFSMQHFALNDGLLGFDDRQAVPPAQLALTGLGLSLSGFSNTTPGNAPYAVQAELAQGGNLGSSGTLNLAAHRLQAQLTLKQLALPALQPWLNSLLAARVTDGQLSAQAGLLADWGVTPAALRVSPAQLDLDGFKLVSAAGGHPLLALGHGTVQLQSLDLATHEAHIASIDLDGLGVEAGRAADGKLDLAGILKHDTGEHHTAAARRIDTPSKSREATPAWRYQIDSFSLARSSVKLIDHAQPQTASLTLAPLQIKLTQISDAFDRPWPFELDGTLNQKGRLAAQGKLTLAPLQVALHLQAKQLDVAAFEPYFATLLNASIASALFNADGELAFGQGEQGWHANYQGNAGLDNVRMLDKQSADLFAGWRSLAVSQIKARYSASGTDLDARRVSLSNFYTRVFLDQNGQLNLRNFVAQQAEPAASLTRTGTPAPALPAEAASASTASATGASAVSAAAGQAAPPAPSTAAAVNLHFGEFLLQNGHINYTDDFIKPNFTANLVQINGKIGAFGSHTTQPASIDVKASVDGRGPVSISGTVNPLISPPALDMTASAKEIELTGFTPYSTKYAGYPITEGRLNLDLHYLLDQGHLSADNHLFIDQLTFGQHVENSTATHLPVTLAIALLKNSRGQIDVNIPISGSLSDPQFSLGGLIWHALANLLEKAVTAPFTLLANAFGGSAEQLQYVAFAPGSAALADEQQKKLETLSQALNDKPAVGLEINGRADPAVDGPALRRQAVDQAIRQAKVKDLVGRGQSIDLSQVQVAPDELDKYLKRAYQAADFKKPRNFIGLDKTIPADQMRQLMEDNTAVTDADLRELAQQRLAVVHQWLAAKVAAPRLHDRSPKIDAQGITDKGVTTRVDFVLK